MLFSKLKPKSDELLPPPPPFPSMELEEKAAEEPLEKKEKSKAEKQKFKSQKDDFDDLFKEVESLKAGKVKAPKIKTPKTDKKPIAKIKEKVKLKPAKPLKETKFVKKLPEIKIKAKLVKPAKAVRQKIKEPEELESKAEDFEFPELEETESFEEDIGKIESKPKEIQDAQDEIKSAIEKIKERERPSFFQKLFARKEKQEVMEKPAADDVSAIKSYIENARQALMKFDLDAARKNYIKIMKIYNGISPEEQAKVYQEIKDLYSERKSAEELKV